MALNVQYQLRFVVMENQRKVHTDNSQIRTNFELIFAFTVKKVAP